MSKLTAAQFGEFFRAIYQHDPMDWQSELAAHACEGRWFDYISLPTGAGKTSAIDIALFALAVQSDLPPEQRTAAMRTFLVVDRRTVVNEAYCRALHLQDRLHSATGGVLKTVADRLRTYGGEQAVAVVQLRGGIYRDPSWCNSLVQPMIVTSTVDQVGSRLLFRGYGVSNSSRPMQAAAVAHDSLIILDEAHISQPFSETLAFVSQYQQDPWAKRCVPLPLRIVEMTATPPDKPDATRLEISASELADASTHIGNIVNTPKLTKLELADKVKGANAHKQLAKILVDRAIEHLGPESASDMKVAGIMSNNVATAKEAYDLLASNKNVDRNNVFLVIGSMRPNDRDKQTDRLRELISTGADREAINGPIYVVATQCIEVGADYDFDVLVTEAAPISALVQRFGRLNRKGRDIQAVGHIIMRGDRLKPNAALQADEKAFKNIDPIYGNEMSYSWNWLGEIATDETVDFGIAAFKLLKDGMDAPTSENVAVEDSHAPALLPSHLDLLCQTTLDPIPNPDVSLWLHGPRRNDPEVQVCWRADLMDAIRDTEREVLEIATPSTPADAQAMIHTVSLCPPSAPECISVPMRRLIKWLESLSSGKKVEADASGDVPSIAEDDFDDRFLIPPSLRPLAWRGIEHSEVIEASRDIRPGDTLVFPVTAGGWNDLGYIPDAVDDKGKPLTGLGDSTECASETFDSLRKIDIASEAYQVSRAKPILRLHPQLLGAGHAHLIQKAIREGEGSISSDAMKSIFREVGSNACEAFYSAKNDRIQPGVRWEYYPNGCGVVAKGPRTPASDHSNVLTLMDDDGHDIYSQIEGDSPIELAGHCDRVKAEVERSLKRLPFQDATNTLVHAAATHDWGKADPRFQALLLGGDLYSALWEDRLYAKSAKLSSNVYERQRNRTLSKLPTGFRHELLSVSLIEKADRESWNIEDETLLLHLVATHHGYARPWVPVCIDNEPTEVSLAAIDKPNVTMSQEERNSTCDHSIDSPLIERFWETVETYGWWGSAYLESVLRLADRRASQAESCMQSPAENNTRSNTQEQSV